MKVRVGKVYVYQPVPIDLWDNRIHLAGGTKVRVINLPGAPKANTMNHCYVEKVSDGQFAGMVCCNSLQPNVK